MKGRHQPLMMTAAQLSGSDVFTAGCGPKEWRSCSFCMCRFVSATTHSPGLIVTGTVVIVQGKEEGWMQFRRATMPIQVKAQHSDYDSRLVVDCSTRISYDWEGTVHGVVED